MCTSHVYSTIVNYTAEGKIVQSERDLRETF